MMTRKAREAGSLTERWVLRTESRAEFDNILADISQDIGPTNYFEKMKVEDAAYYTWQILRYRRVITGIFNKALPVALARILFRIRFPDRSLLSQSNLLKANHETSLELANQWCANQQEAKLTVLTLLEEAGLDQTAIEAEAYTIAADDLDNANRMLDSARGEFDKSHRSLAKYRKSLAALVRQNVNRVLAADDASSIPPFSVN